MEPYYDKDGITIYHGDCREVLPSLEPCDLLLTDPPYGISYCRGYGGNGKHVRRNDIPVAGDDEPFDPSPFVQFDNVILWGANHYSSRLPHGRWIAWDKLDGLEPWDTFSDVEFAWMKGRGKDRIVSRLWKGICQDGNRGDRRYHPTQKPTGVMGWCIGLVPNVETILDPFMGSGTTLVAAKLLGRKAIGIEIEERYCEIAVNRLRQQVLSFTD